MMASSRSQLMASLRQSLDAFGHNMLPLTGVVGFQIPLLSMDTSQQILSHVSQEHGKTLDGLEVLAALDKQRAFLLQSGPLDEEDGARTALLGWRLIQDKYARAPLSALSAAHALEDAALHTHSLAAPPRSTWWMEEDDAEQPLERGIDCALQLDALAQHVRFHNQALFSQDLGKGQDLQWAQADQMHAIAQTLSEHLRFRHDPYEWVYQGFAPLLLPDVVTNKLRGLREDGTATFEVRCCALEGKGISLSLATLVLCVMRRLGLTARPVIRQEVEADLSIIGRQAGGPPPPATILLLAGSSASPCVLDAGGKRGAWVLPDLEAASIGAQAPSVWEAEQVFRLWAEHARTMMIACQRRGESDDVAKWMYQHAALDPRRADVPGM